MTRLLSRRCQRRVWSSLNAYNTPACIRGVFARLQGVARCQLTGHHGALVCLAEGIVLRSAIDAASWQARVLGSAMPVLQTTSRLLPLYILYLTMPHSSLHMSSGGPSEVATPVPHHTGGCRAALHSHQESSSLQQQGTWALSFMMYTSCW